MRVLLQDQIGNTIQYLKSHLPYVGDMAQIIDMQEIAKALNEFQPDIVVLQSAAINTVVKAYCKKNNAKLICYGEPVEDADINIVASQYLGAPNSYPDSPRPKINSLTFKTDIDKTDISVFLNRQNESLIANYLAKNYNVKIYGNVKINSPKYLGIVSDQEKYDILNKSKIMIDLGSYDFHDAIFLGVYPIVYTDMELPEYFTTFNDLVSLTSQLDFAIEQDNKDQLDTNMKELTEQCCQNNDVVFVINILNNLGFTTEANKLSNILNNILENVK
ncbi:MAG: hypothetical protein ACXADW_18725 [Candidatus Hodarchaeales archaeon]|jgi:hypothetical protein